MNVTLYNPMGCSTGCLKFEFNVDGEIFKENLEAVYHQFDTKKTLSLQVRKGSVIDVKVDVEFPEGAGEQRCYGFGIGMTSDNAVFSSTGLGGFEMHYENKTLRNPFPIQGKITVFDPKFITPAGDPVRFPVDEEEAVKKGGGQNEFTFSYDDPGVLVINAKVKVMPEGSAEKMKALTSFEFDGIGGTETTVAYSEVEVEGDYLKATATYTGLPKKNSDFGKKTVKLKYNNNVILKQQYEVFFQRDGDNHPIANDTHGSLGKSQNWFYYWKEGEVCGIPDDALFDTDVGNKNPNRAGWVNFKGNDKRIRLCKAGHRRKSPKSYRSQLNGYSSVEITRETEGIWSVASVVWHENMHLEIGKLSMLRDRDMDQIGDEHESYNGGVGFGGIKTSTNNKDTYNISAVFSGYALNGDNEIRAIKAEDSFHLNLEVKEDRDWAKPGYNHKKKYGYSNKKVNK